MQTFNKYSSLRRAQNFHNRTGENQRLSKFIHSSHNSTMQRSNCDFRSYREVVKGVPLVEGEVIESMSEKLHVSFICSEDSVLELTEVKEKLKETSLKEFNINKMDDFSTVITKIEQGKIFPWHKEYGLMFCRRYELFGIPIHQ